MALQMQQQATFEAVSLVLPWPRREAVHRLPLVLSFNKSDLPKYWEVL